MPGVVLFLITICGILFALFARSGNVILSLIFLTLSIFVFSFIQKRLIKITALLLFALIGFLSFYKSSSLYLPDIPKNYLNTNINLNAKVLDFSKQTVAPNTFEISHITINGKEFSGIGRVYFISEPPPPYSTVEIKGKIVKYPVNGPLEKLNKVEYTIYADDVKVEKSYQIFRTLSVMRNRIKKNSFLSMKSNASLLFLSSVCGISSLSYKEKTPFIDTGTAHIFAISGLHIGILGDSIEKFSSIFTGQSTPTISLIFLLMFVFLVGFRISALRAFIMYGIAALAKLTGREQIPLNTLSLTAVTILLFSPFALFNVSFQMSFAAIFGLFIVAPIIQTKLPKNIFYRMVSEVIAVQVVLYPLLAYYFHTFSIVSFFANLIVIPLLYIVMPVGLIQLILSLVSLNAAKIFAPITNITFNILYKVIYLFSQIPRASVNVSFNGYLLSIYFFALAGLLLTFSKKRPFKYIFVFLLILSIAIPFIIKPQFVVYALPLKGEDGFIIVSKHNTIYITSPTVLKSENTDLYAIENNLKTHGINKIDLMIFDAPFINTESSSTQLIGNFPIQYVLIPKANSELENAFYKLNNKNTNIFFINPDSVITLKDMQFTFLNGGNKNIVMLKMGRKKYLFIGKGIKQVPNLPDVEHIYRANIAN